jgi:regulatory protein
VTLELKNRALRMLARREHSRAELAHKLAAHGNREDIQAVLDQLEQSALLSDARFAEAFVAARAARCGATKLRHGLRARGIAEELIASVLPADGEGEGEAARAREVWRRKFGTLPQDRGEYARQARFLQGRGFSGEAIRRVLKGRGE